MSILKHLTTIQAIAKATDQTLSTLRWLATQFRAAHLFSHKAHINVGGDAFIANHEWLGEIYPQFDGYWDALTERIKGLGGAAMIDKVNSDAAKMSEAFGEGDNDFYFRTILQMVSQAVGVINEAAKETTMDEGVRDLIVGISSELQVLQYKIGQRLGGVEKSMMTICKDKDAKGHGSEKHGDSTPSPAWSRAPLDLSRLSEKENQSLDSADKGKRDEFERSKIVDNAKFTAKEKQGMDYYAKFKAGKMHVDSTPDQVRAQLREDDSGRSKPLTDAQVEYLTRAIKAQHGEHIDMMRDFKLHKGLTSLQSFQANIGKAGRGWYHGNQHEAGGTSVRAGKYASLMKQSKEAYKGGSTIQAKTAEMEAMEHWKKMADGERSHAMQMLNDSAAEDIGKSRDRGFEFGHGRTSRK